MIWYGEVEECGRFRCQAKKQAVEKGPIRQMEGVIDRIMDEQILQNGADPKLFMLDWLATSESQESIAE
ncbi:unnamed protein product [Sphenostylis stenocarpa]|uniref:Uncharacterized protein n=1 Tax=Sphenostylis stenocarpa TaxID=92480 RepID=A0AA86S6A6_9FABA|nr:unnamed protein product [Sphenostylis stenocarpa]